MKENNRILVTGARGFIGRHLRNYLVQKGFNVIENEGGRKNGALDVTNLHQVLSIESRVDTIIHLAAKSSVKNSFQSPHDTYYANITGTLNMLEFARQKKVNKFMYLSTYVYGPPQYLPINEYHPLNPHSPYNKSKVIAERLCEFYSQDFKINIVTLRPFYIYGPCPRPNTFVYCILEQIIKKNGNVILSGELTRRDFLFIDDFLGLIEKVLERFPTGYNLFNVGCGKSYSLTEVSKILAKLLKKKITIHYDNDMRPGDIMDMSADISSISSMFDWRPSTSLIKGLGYTVKSYLSAGA